MKEGLISLLDELENKSKLLPSIGKETFTATPDFYTFDIYVNGLLNRSINLIRGFISLMKDNNFISAAPLVRLHLDSLLRFYAAQIIDYNVDDFALKIFQGTSMRKLKDKDGKNLTDARLVEKISELEDFKWVVKVYETGNSYIHYCDMLMYASSKKTNNEDRIVCFTIGGHDDFIPISEKQGAVFWMNEITDGLILLVNSWIIQKRSYKERS